MKDSCVFPDLLGERSEVIDLVEFCGAAGPKNQQRAVA